MPRLAFVCALGLVVLRLFTPDVASAQAEVYKVTLTRVDRNAYWDRFQRLVLLTRGCIEYAYLDDARVLVRGDEAVIRFSSGAMCEVASVARPNAYLRREAENFYVDDLHGAYVWTQLCLELTLGEDALVLSNRVLFLESRSSCPRY